jgi:CubicO group peptidase (beta-lactamase class C family)
MRIPPLLLLAALGSSPLLRADPAREARIVQVAPAKGPDPAGNLPAQGRPAPDEDDLGKAEGYPVGTASTWFTSERVRVGSFTAQGEIAGIAHGGVHALAPAAHVLALPRAAAEPAYRWSLPGAKGLTVDDYLARQRIMGLLVIKDGVVQVERYQYGRRPDQRFLSNSMAKSILSLGIGIALAEGRIRSLDDPAERYVPALAGSLLGGTALRDLLRMASGARYLEDYSGYDDAARFGAVLGKVGIERAARIVTERDYAPGTHFSYGSVQAQVLGAVLSHAAGASVSDYLAPRLWQAIGAETSALWRTDRTGLELAGGHFNATLRDYGRLGVVLANDGVRPDDPKGTRIVPLDYLLDATDWHRAAEPFRPGRATRYFGYGNLFWLFPGERRRFAMLGVFGQMLFVDPGQKLVMVQTAANATASSHKTALAREADAFWRGLVAFYGPW